MSEYQGNYNAEEPQSYSFTGSAPQMGPEDFFSLKPTPDGMKPIVDPKTRMCIGYDDQEGAVYDFEGKFVGRYAEELPPLDFTPDPPDYEDVERRAYGGSVDDIYLGIAAPGMSKALSSGARILSKTRTARKARIISKKTSKTVVNGIVSRSPESVQRAHNLLKERKAAIKIAKLDGRRQGVPTKITISKEILAAPIIFALRNKLKMALSSLNIKFDIEAIKRMRDPNRYVPVDILVSAIKKGTISPDQSNRAFGLMYKMYNIIVTREGSEEIKVLEVLFNERTGTIKHFLYQDESKFWRSIASKELQYSKETILKKPFIKDMNDFKNQLHKTRELNIKLPPKIKKK